MKPPVSINKESLHNAMRKCVATYEKFGTFMSAQERHIISQSTRIDARDLTDLAAILKYEKVFLDPAKGKELTDEEFEKECRTMIKVFADNDIPKMYEYFDRWHNVIASYSVPEHIETEIDAIKNYLFLRSQQGLTVTEVQKNPAYMASRVKNIDDAMKMQKQELDLFIMSGMTDYVYMENGVRLDTGSIRILDGANAQKKADLAGFCRMYLSIKDEGLKTLYLAQPLVDSLKLNQPSPVGEASVKKLEPLPEWFLALGGKDENGVNRIDSASADDMQAITQSLVATFASAFTENGLMRKYCSFDQSDDRNLYRMVYIDGESLYDSLPEPKTLRDAEKKLADALLNRTGVVSFVHVAEIGDKFEYRVDVLDASKPGEYPEYAAKISSLSENAEERKALFDKITSDLDKTMTEARERYNAHLVNTVKTDAEQRIQTSGRYERDKGDYRLSDKNMEAAYKPIDEARKQYRKATEKLLARTYVDAKGNVAPNPIAESFSKRNVDTRDFLDMIVFVANAQTFGVGDKNLTPEETRVAATNMVLAFAFDDHDSMKPYLDKMFDFLENYNPPTKIESAEDLMKAVMYIRVQQCTSVKRIENPWYIQERCPTIMDQARFGSFEETYYIVEQMVYSAMLKDTGFNAGAPGDYAMLLEKKQRLQALAEDDEENDELELSDRAMEQFLPFARSYVTERRRRLSGEEEFEQKHTFRVQFSADALALVGDNPDKKAFEEAAKYFWSGCIAHIYNLTFNDSKVLRSYRFENSGYGNDSMRLIYIDGKSVHDIVAEKNNGNYDQKQAQELLFSTLINQSGLVQFARVLQGKDEVKVELDTLDVTTSSYAKQEYVQKLAAYVNDPDGRYNAIKADINAVLKEHKLEYEKDPKNFNSLEKEQWDELAKSDEDLFAPSEYDKQQEAARKAEQAKQEAERKESRERMARYVKEQEAQWKDFLQADLDLFEDEQKEEKVEQKADEKGKEEAEEERIIDLEDEGEIEVRDADDNVIKTTARRDEWGDEEFIDYNDANVEALRKDKALGNAKAIDFQKFKEGRYFVQKKDPNSSYAKATMGELSNLGVFFGGITAAEQHEYIPMDEDVDGFASLDESKEDARLTAAYAERFGVVIDKTIMESIIGGFLIQNRSEDGMSLDKTVYERQYKMLFTDLYTHTLNTVNKQCIKNGMTISADQMTESAQILDIMMRNAAKETSSPIEIKDGGYTPAELNALQNKFIDEAVPKNSEEKALRAMQAGNENYDFDAQDWKNNLGYADFTAMVRSETAKVGLPVNANDEEKQKLAQTYRAMIKYSENRSWWSKFFHPVRLYRERNAIQEFKNRAMENYNMGEREFNDMLALKNNDDVTATKNGLKADMEARNRIKSVESSAFESDNLSVTSENSSVMRISVSEADHKKKNERTEDINTDAKEVNRSRQP